MSPEFDAIINRDNEKEQLQGLLGRGTPQLVLVYGRRRVGKTHLLNRVWPAASSFYFTAAETTSAQNRDALLSSFAEWRGEPINIQDYPTWRTVFRLLLDHRSPEPLAITIDEFQYLGETERELNSVASELNAAWEMRRPARPMVLVLAGSAVSILESLSAGGSPLYGRFAWQHRLRPFDYWYAGEMAGFRTPRDRAYAYGVFGGTPRYLAAIDAGLTLEENIRTRMLAPSGEVRELVRAALLQEQGLRDIPKYTAILRAIGRGRNTLNEIAQGAGLAMDTALREKLDRLVALDYVSAGRNLEAKSREPFRYRIADPALRFFYEFVAPWESVLDTQPVQAVWDRHIAPTLDGYMGLAFERMVEQAYYRLQGALDLPLVSEWGRWEGVDRNRQSLEIDIASRLADGRVLSGAIKWSRNRVDVDVHNGHLVMLDRLAEAGHAWAHEARNPASPLLYVAAGGFSPRFRRAAEASRNEVYLWTLEELYGSVAGGR